MSFFLLRWDECAWTIDHSTLWTDGTKVMAQAVEILDNLQIQEFTTYLHAEVWPCGGRKLGLVRYSIGLKGGAWNRVLLGWKML